MSSEIAYSTMNLSLHEGLVTVWGREGSSRMLCLSSVRSNSLFNMLIFRAASLSTWTFAPELFSGFQRSLSGQIPALLLPSMFPSACTHPLAHMHPRMCIHLPSCTCPPTWAALVFSLSPSAPRTLGLQFECCWRMEDHSTHQLFTVLLMWSLFEYRLLTLTGPHCSSSCVFGTIC